MIKFFSEHVSNSDFNRCLRSFPFVFVELVRALILKAFRLVSDLALSSDVEQMYEQFELLGLSVKLS